MAGSHPRFRHLSRTSAHRKALLRNLVTSLFEHESITTTWHKAKEAQRLAEKLVTLGKKNTAASRRRAHEIFFKPLQLIPKLFGPLRQRYASRPGGYTRVLRTEPQKEDQAASAILELVDGPRDMRWSMTAQTVARDRVLGRSSNALTLANVDKVNRFRGSKGVERFNEQVGRFVEMEREGWKGARLGGAGSEEEVENKAREKRKLFGPGRGDQYYSDLKRGGGMSRKRAMQAID